MTTAYIINASTSLCALIITLVLAMASALGTDVKRPLQRWFLITVLLNLSLILAELGMGLLFGHTGVVADVLIRVLDFSSYAVAGLQIYAFGMYLYLYLGCKATVSIKVMHLITAISMAAVLLAGIAQVNHMYAFFDAHNAYHAQPTYWISLVCPIFALAVYLALTARNIKHLAPREWISLLLYALVPLVCYIIETMNPDIWISHFGSSITILMIYMNIQLELRHQLEMQQAELTENRIAIMLSQIQPHFLYNALSTIDDLVYENAEAAHKAIFDFSNYLRNNMDALTQRETIPFGKELEHTRQYLRIEKLRFHDRLRIEYDIQSENFNLPVLTLQPIVENAVRYGVTKKRDGGTITIRAEEMPACYRITVTDDGVGFDPEKKQLDGRVHSGISNVRSRLAAMCGGMLTIHSAPGSGTCVLIEIPRKERAS